MKDSLLVKFLPTSLLKTMFSVAAGSLVRSRDVRKGSSRSLASMSGGLLAMLTCVASLWIAGAAFAQTAVVPPVADVLARVRVDAPATLPGQSATLLSDGRWLLLGGNDGTRVLPSVQTYDDVTGETTTLPATLAVPRAFHSATVLPDGTVLVLGGENASGVPMQAAERFDPEIGQFVPAPRSTFLPRSRHTATLMPDGRLLVAGGRSANGSAIADLELVDAITLQVAPIVPRMGVARADHKANLLASGFVLLSGGLPAASAAAAAELFDPSTSTIVRYQDAAAGTLPDLPYLALAPAVMGFLPASGISGIALDTRFVVRLNKPMLPESLDGFSLTGLGARVPIGIVATEGGMLVFVQPLQTLKASTRYALWVQNGSDESGRGLVQVAAGYQTAGATATGTGTTGTGTAGTTTGSVPPAASAGTSQVTLSTGVWTEVPNSLMRSVVPPYDMRKQLYGSPQGVIDAWSGGDYDTVRHQLVLWGGGHGDYAGNELYAFNIDTLKWSRLNDPSIPAPPDVVTPGKSNPANAYYPDGKPRSRHTYGYVVYVPSIDRFCSIGGSSFFVTGQTGTDSIDCFNFVTKAWTKLGTSGSYGRAMSAYDSATKTVWTMGDGNAALLSQLNPATGISTVRSGVDNVLKYNLASMNVALDPKRRKLVLVGSGQVYWFNIGASGLLTKETVPTTGATAIVAAHVPGLLYDPISDRIIAWAGGSDLYSLNLDTKVWTRLAATSGSIDPGPSSPNGTFGRFRYAPSKDLYVAVSSVDDSVFLFKPQRPVGAVPPAVSVPPVVSDPNDPGPGAPPPVAPLPTPGAAFTVPLTLSDSGFTTARSNVPVTFGHVFRMGDIPAAYSVGARTKAGAALETQVDVKARHPDGSLRHAVVTVMLPSETAVATDIVLFARAAPVTAAPLATSVVTARSTDLGTVTLNIGGVAYTAKASPAFALATDRWLSGPLVTEWRVPVVPVDATGKPHPHLQVVFDIRAYRGLQYLRTDFTVEHSWSYEPNTQPYTYDAVLSLDGKVVYSKTALTHYPQARWRKVFWLGGNDSRITAKYEIGYLLATGAVPNFDRAVVPSRTAMLGAMNFMLPRSEPLMAGFIDEYMPGVGNHHDLGLVPGLAASYLLSMDDLARAFILRSGDLFGSFSVHYRDRAARKMLSIIDYPYASTTNNLLDAINPVTKASERVAFALCLAASTTCRSVLSAENGAHQPSEAYVPYLITGDRYYLEELQFWANYNLIDQTPAYRDFDKGLFHRNQVRAQGWAMRTAGQAAYITPDNDPLKAYFLRNLNNNITYYDQTAYGLFPMYRNLGAIDEYAFAYNNGTGLAPWQDDVFTQAIGHIASDLGFAQARSLAVKKSKFVIGRMTDPGYCWIMASSYTLNAKASATDPPVATFGELYRLNFGSYATSDGSRLVDQACGSAAMANFLIKYNLEATRTTLRLAPGEMVGYSDSYNGYPMHMQPPLAYAVDLGVPGAAQAWATFSSRATQPVKTGDAYLSLSISPHFAILPRK